MKYGTLIGNMEGEIWAVKIWGLFAGKGGRFREVERTQADVDIVPNIEMA